MLTKSVEVSAWINSGQILDVMNASIKDYQYIFVVFVTSMRHSKTLNQARYRLGYGLEGHKELRTGGGGWSQRGSNNFGVIRDILHCQFDTSQTQSNNLQQYSLRQATF